MPDSDTLVTVEGFDQLRQMIDRAPELISPIAAEAIDNSLRAIYAVVEPYPPETIANSPQNPSGKWYERHYGPRWIRKRQGGGEKSALDVTLLTSRKRVNIFEGAGLVGGSPTSEQLQLRWQLVPAQPDESQTEIGEKSALVGELDNTASYAEWVQGPLEIQSETMKAIGWKSVDDGIAETAEDIDQIWDVFTQNAIDVMAGV